MSILIDIVPSKYRKYAVYAPYAAAGLVLGALQLAADFSWLPDALAVYAFLGTALGLTAYANTNPPVTNDTF